MLSNTMMNADDDGGDDEQEMGVDGGDEVLVCETQSYGVSSRPTVRFTRPLNYKLRLKFIKGVSLPELG